MRRVISLYLPHWPTDRLRRVSKDAPPRDRPLVTAIMQGQNACSRALTLRRKLDLSSGMTVTHAQSLIPDLDVVDATPEMMKARLFAWHSGASNIRRSLRLIRPTEFSLTLLALHISFKAKPL